MAVIRNKIPILEYDDSPEAVIMPCYEQLDLQLPERMVFAFLGDVVERYAEDHECRMLGEYVSINGKIPVYSVRFKGKEIGLCQARVGAAAAVQFMDWLIGYGARKIIAAGSCGVLTDIPENAFLVPVRALRDEGASYHYLPPSRFVEINERAYRTIENTLDGMKLPYAECATWTTDGFFRETRDKVEYRRSEGCQVVEMECAALAACAQLRGVEFAQLLYTADSLANADAYDERGWGGDSLEKALMLCLETAAVM